MAMVKDLVSKYRGCWTSRWCLRSSSRAELAHETYRKRLNPDGAPDKLGYTKGGRYWRLFVSRGGKEDQRSAYGFFEPATGNLYKSDGWKRPAKGVRASVLDKSTWNRADFSGIR